MYLIQGTDSTPHLTAPLEQFEAMYNEGIPDYFVDHGLYYPNAIGYGYVCTGFEPTGGWEDHTHMIMGVDGQDIQYTGASNENLPYGYFTPSYGYGQSPYNPYNPYIPGAMIGADGSIVAAHQCYSLPSYENSVSPPYVPVVLRSGPDAVAVGMADSSLDSVASVDRVDGLGTKHQLCTNTRNSLVTAVGDASSQRKSFARVSEGGRANTGFGKQPVPGITSGRFTSQSSLQVPQVRGSQGMESGLHGMASSCRSQLKSAFPTTNGSYGLESSNHTSVKVKSKVLYGNKLKNQLVVKAYTTRAGNRDPQGNITIFTDQYNKEDFPVDYVNAKFFVIKSYSEDDVHKSIKYNVWSSTPNGNKKLNAAYEDALRICAGESRGCPIFLFFSVNASGQFCGVAEMIGSVDFDRDMDFWQQDKWSASFPVKWHIIKDLPNLNLRHIILENNENKPVTNSRDTQEICYKKGLEMLQIFKSYAPKTSLLDDFMYYENRQQIIQEERSRYLVPLLDPPRKLQSVNDFPCIGANSKSDANNLTVLNNSKGSTDANTHSTAMGQVSLHSSDDKLTGAPKSHQVSADEVPNAVDELKISSLTMHSDEVESVPSLAEGSLSDSSQGAVVNVVTIGSMPVKVVGTESSSSILTVGTIPLDPRALRHEL